MRSPLNKRLPRELKQQFGRYFVIFILMVFSIGLVSGFLVADGSMIKAYNDSFDRYVIENGHFVVNKKLNLSTRKTLEEKGINIYENFYTEITLENDKTIRLFKDRKYVNKVCLMSGRMPEKDNEIAVDRMFADNNGYKIGDVLHGEENDYVISGLVALSDYSALFSDNADIIFDAVSFSVAIVTDNRFEQLSPYTCDYAFRYLQQPENEAAERDMADALMKEMNSEINMTSFVPRYLNQAIMFTGTDMGSDRGMMEVLLVIIIAILAFIFAVTASSSIQQDMTVIGTLMASGYTKRELIIHYMTLPVIVTLFSSAVGNLLGYTYFEKICADLYYGSYSLPTYETVFSLNALVKTTLIPFVMMLVINWFILRRKLNMPILNFLRRQNTSRKNKKRIRLSQRIPFFARYRLRVFFQNIPSYAVLLVGILFANLLIFFGLDFPAILDHYEIEMQTNPLAPYITMLSMPESFNRDDHMLEGSLEMLNFVNAVQTDNPTAEKFSAYRLKSAPDDSMEYKGEDIMVYGLQDDSAFVKVPLDSHQVYVSSRYADKFRLKTGDSVLLKEQYEDKYYRFEVDGVYDYLGGLCVIMPMDDLNEVFDLGKGTFVGYMSETAITDIDREYLGSVIDVNALTKLSRQMKVSFGSMMDLVVYFAVVVYVVLVYVLTKLMIENNAQSISMNKIMGYNNWEIARLYLVTSSLVFLIMLLGSVPFEVAGLKLLFRYMMIAKMSGWFPLEVYSDVIMKVIVIAIVSYVAVSAFEYRRISAVPMDQALKNVE